MTSHKPQQANTTPPVSDTPPYRYNAELAGKLELGWQQRWQRDGTFVVPNPGQPGFDGSRPKFFVLDMFPYPSGAGLHVGHPEGYTATDIVSRYMRMKGYSVLHPMGWDAFGLPAEQYAIQTGIHPSITTRKAIETFRSQLQRFGFCYDWSREFATIDPDYYRWTQWIFLRLYNAWYDPQSRPGEAPGGKARPIGELTALLERGIYGINMFGELVAAAGMPGAAEGLPIAIAGDPVNVRLWHELSQEERRAFLDSHRLAYVAEQTVNWCPKLGTVLANEEVTGEGRSERGDFPVYRKKLRQWMFRITAYAERLLSDLSTVEWPESTRTMQTEWIGRSEGAEVDFPIVGREESLTVYTTRPDTIFGATYMVIAPEHELVDDVLANPPAGADAAAIRAYIHTAKSKGEVERMAEGKDKSGVFTGLYAQNPANNAKIPIWIADYVLMGYGTGAIMAVPGQDQRDWDFAHRFNLPIVRTVKPPEGFDGKAFTGDGPAMNSGFLDGMTMAAAKSAIIDWLEKEGLGKRKVNYKLRDWLFSRQRYWGEPFPIVFDAAGNHYPVSESALPVRLPEMEHYKPGESDDPQPMLANAPSEWLNTTAGKAGVDPSILPPETPVRREANTMPNWAGSCWYYLRFSDPKNAGRFVSKEAEAYWLGKNGVDLYIGGSEHAVLHLLYARFWHKALFDLGFVSSPEPMRRLFHQGLITSYAYQRKDRTLVPVDQVTMVRADGSRVALVGDPRVDRVEEAEKFVETATDEPLQQVIAKMSKSLKNVVNPDDVIAEFGADTMRLYEMYMGPLEASKPWNPRDITGLFRFLQRAWRMMIDENSGQARLAGAPDEKVERELHRTIARIGPQIEKLSFNTAIADLIKFVNAVPAPTETTGSLSKSQAERFALLLAPFAPHMAEEMWSRLGHAKSLADEPWPTHDEAMLRESSIEIPVQVMGKLRGRITVPAGADNKALEAAALADPTIKQLIEGKKIQKVIVVPGKLVNIVAS